MSVRILLLPLVACCLLAAAGQVLAWKVDGADTQLEQNLLSHLASLPQEAGLSEGYLQSRLQVLVTEACRALGYYQADFHADLEQQRLAITPGPQVRWRTIAVALQGDGAEEAELLAWQQHSPLQPGMPLHHGDYENYKKAGLDKALQLGYLDARYSRHELRINVAEHAADVSWQLQTGPLYHFTDVRFKGSALKPEVLSQLNPIQAGERYHAGRIADLYARFTASGYFADVKVTPVDDGEYGQALEVSLVDAAYHQLTTGVGFSTDTGVRLRLGWDQPEVNDNGHQWFNEAQFSQVEQTLSSEYRVPLTDPLNHYVAVNLGWQRTLNEDTDSQVLSTSLSWHRIYASGWQRSYKIGMEHESYQQGDEPSESVLYLIPAISLSKTRFSGTLRSQQRGYKVWTSISASSEVLGAEADFSKWQAGAKYLYPLTQEQALLARAEAGMIVTDDIFTVPASQRFFTGGDQTVRGYDYESLAPESEGGELIGGKYLNVASLEYRWQYRSHWQWALFYDTGRAYNEADMPWSSGAGIGWHWQSPIGPIRFDIAWPLDEDTRKPRLHITMGPTL